MTRAFVVVVAAIAAWSGAARADAPRRYAIVIGVNAPDRGDAPELRYADDDAVATHRLLTEAGVDSVLLTALDADTRRLHPALEPDAAPTWRGVRAAFAAVAERMRAAGGDVELLVFYSGHGDVDGGEGYLALTGARLTRARLFALLEASPAARKHVIVDACKSYFIAFEKGPGGSREPYHAGFARLRAGNTGFVLSTSSERDSHEWERFGGGVFSHEVRSGLRGAADVDGDGRITYAELGAFLATANRAIANARLRPDFTVIPPDDLSDEVLAWPSDRAALVVDVEVGHVYVENAAGERLIDAHAASGQELALRLPADRPLFVRAGDGSREYRLDARSTRLSALTAGAASVARRGALHLAFEQLFAEPFGAADVDRWRARFAPVELSGPGADRDDRRAGARRAAGWIAAGSLLLGGGASVYAWQRGRQGTDASQRERVRLNRQIDVANHASVGLFAAAAVAGAAWWWLRDGDTTGLAVTPAPGGLTVSYEASW